MTRRRSVSAAAWGTGLLGTLACIAAAGLTIALGFTDELAPVVLGYSFGALMGLLGGLVAAREPGNSVGWLMCLAAIATSLVNLPADYGYLAVAVAHGRWAFASEALWLSAWSWIVVVGVALPVIAVRFPDGRVTVAGRVAEVAAVGGALLFAIGAALGSRFVPAVPARIVPALAPYLVNPLGVSLPGGRLAELQMLGLPTILLGYVLAAVAVARRFRRGSPEERTQLKWFVSAGLLVGTAAVGGGMASLAVGEPMSRALIPFELVLVALPIAIAVAILRYRLYDIDLIINRTLVYGGSTAFVGALYVAVTTFLQRMFVSLSGQRSDTAAVAAAFVVVAAFGPIKDWLQRRVDAHLGGTSPVAALDRLRADIEVIVAVLDVPRVACTFLDHAMDAFDARSAALYLGNDDGPFYRRGPADDEPGVEVPLEHDGRAFGRLVLGTRPGNAQYSDRERNALQGSAEAVGEALALVASPRGLNAGLRAPDPVAPDPVAPHPDHATRRPRLREASAGAV